MSYDSMNTILNSIIDYFNNNDITELVAYDVDQLSNLTQEQQDAIRANITGYSDMAEALITTN
jgi:hypothetical protein